MSSDSERHAERVPEIERLGATMVWLQNGFGAAPERVLLVCGEQVRPRSAERGSNR